MLWSKEELDTYLHSLEEGDNITITADFLNMLESASEDLEILEILKNNGYMWSITKQFRTNDLTQKEYKKVERWLKIWEV